jgi:hypothetical protein
MGRESSKDPLLAVRQFSDGKHRKTGREFSRLSWCLSGVVSLLVVQTQERLVKKLRILLVSIAAASLLVGAGALALAGACGAPASRVAFASSPLMVSMASTSAELAQQLRGSRIVFATVHASGIRDNANANQNIIDASNGLAAARSSYDADGRRGYPPAPGGTVELQPTMLQGLLNIANSPSISATSIQVSELAGGQHSTRNSYHYRGLAFDINRINGARLNSTTAGPLVGSCRGSGASLAQFENNNHVHCQWAS